MTILLLTKIQRIFCRLGYSLRRWNPLYRYVLTTHKNDKNEPKQDPADQDIQKSPPRRKGALKIGMVIVPLLVLMLAAVGLFRFGGHKAQTPAASITVLQQQTLGQLNRIEGQLQTIASHADTAESSQQDDAKFNAQLTQIAQTLSTLSTQDDTQKTQALITESNQAVSERIDQLQTLLEKIKNQVTPKRYLPASVLPFIVKDVIGINGIVKVIIADRDRGNYIPLAEQESLGDWRVVSVNYDPKEVVFENPSKQSVKINLSR